MENVEIGKRIKQRRIDMEISAIELAEITGLSKATIHRYENGEIKNIKLPVVSTIASHLGVSTEWLSGESENMHQGDEDKMRPEDRIVQQITELILERLEEESNSVAERIKARQAKPNITHKTKAQKQIERLALLFRNGVIDEEEYYEFVNRVKEKYKHE